MKYAYSAEANHVKDARVTGRRKLLRSFLLLVVLALVWVVCSGFFKPFFLISGLLSSLLALWISHRMDVVDEEERPLGLTLRSPFYFLWLLKEMVVSSLRVSRLSLMQAPVIDPAFDKVKSGMGCDMAHTIYANSITMTPGTVTISVMEDKGKTEFLVHALEKDSIADLKEGRMAGRIKQFVNSDGDGA